MAVVAHATGTTAQSVGTELTLDDIAIAGTFTAHVDLNLMASGDTVELRWYAIILTGGTRRVCYFETRSGAQIADDMIAISVPISNELTDAGALRFTIKQTAGTTRAFPWKVLRYV